MSRVNKSKRRNPIRVNYLLFLILNETFQAIVSNKIDTQQFPEIEVIAHRGASGIYPDHSLQAYHGAGPTADYIECDVAVTKDLVLVCLHSLELSNSTNFSEVYPNIPKKRRMWGFPVAWPRKNWFSIDYTYPQLYELGLVQEKSYRDSKYNGGKIVPLKTYMSVAQKWNIGVYIESKEPNSYNKWLKEEKGLNTTIEELIIDEFNKHDFSKSSNSRRCYFQSFSSESLIKLKQLNTYKNCKFAFLSQILTLPTKFVDNLADNNITTLAFNKNTILAADYFNHIVEGCVFTAGGTLKRYYHMGFELHVFVFKNENQFLLFDFGQDYAKEIRYWLKTFPYISAYFTDFSDSFRNALDEARFKWEAKNGSVRYARGYWSYLVSIITSISIFSIK